MKVFLVFCLLASSAIATKSQTISKPSVIVVNSGTLKLRAHLWRPRVRGPAPAILFCPGSGQVPSLHKVGRTFAKHGYFFLALYRSGQGLSANQGEESSVVWNRERAANGDDAANRLQLRLLEGEQLQEEIDGLNTLRSIQGVDSRRIAIVGHSFGGSLAMLLAEREPSIGAVINFGGAAGGWQRSAYLRERLMMAVQKLASPVLSIYATNDYSTAPGEVLNAEFGRLGKFHQLKMYPAFGQSTSEGHNIIYLSIKIWERDVFAFLDEHNRAR